MATLPAAHSEEWRAIPGYEGYEASSLGRIKSLDRHLMFPGRWGPTRRFHRGRILRIKVKPNGYCFVYTDGARYLHVHRGVALAFHGQPPSPKHEGAHLNRNKWDNMPSNIVWATHLENMDHARQHGTLPVGSRNGTHVLCEQIIPAIIERYTNGESSAFLAAEFRVSSSAINQVIRAERWSHVASPMRTAAMIRAKQNIFEAPRRDRTAEGRAMAD